MKGHKQDYIVILFAGILLVIIFVITFILLQPQTQPPPVEVEEEITITETPDRINTFPVSYEVTSTRRLLDKLNNKVPLSQADQQAKIRMIGLLPDGKESGVIHKTDTISVDYTKGADQFQVEIMTIDIAQAKADANAWFMSQGMTQKGICDYPIVFYLNFNILNKLRSSGTQFQPVAAGC